MYITNIYRKYHSQNVKQLLIWYISAGPHHYIIQQWYNGAIELLAVLGHNVFYVTTQAPVN